MAEKADREEAPVGVSSDTPTDLVKVYDAEIHQWVLVAASEVPPPQPAEE